jgi:uncharacterized protein YndB with AHSA1/START domain
MEALVVKSSVWIAAPRERVWRAITDPEQIERWLSPGTQWRSTGLGVGAKLYVVNPETGAEMYTQIIELLDPPRQVAMRSQPEPPDTPRFTAWTLDEENGGTRVTVTETGFESMPEEIRGQHIEMDAMGFEMLLANLKAQVEDTVLPYPNGF